MDLTALWETALAGRVPHASWLVTDGDRVLTERDADRMFASASMIKTFVLAHALEEARGGLGAPVTVDPCHRAYGDGVLRLFDLPAALPLRELLRLMIAVSDNTATNAVVDALGGPDAVNAGLAALGFSSRLRGYVGDAGPPAGDRDGIVAGDGLPTRAGLGITSAREHHRVLRRLRDDDEGIAMLREQQDRRALARFLGEQVPFAHKTGTAGGVRHDGGLLLRDGADVSVQVLTDGGPAPEWVDHPACVGMGLAMARTCVALGWDVDLVGVEGVRPVPGEAPGTGEA